MRALALLTLMLAACREPSQVPREELPPARVASDAAIAAAPPAADAAVPDAAIRRAMPVDVPLAPDAVAAVLTREAGESVMLVERAGAIVATTPSGTWSRVLAKAPTRRVTYDSQQRVLWFLRADRLMLIDLTRPTLEEIAIAVGVPDLSIHVNSGLYCPEGCIGLVTRKIPAIVVVGKPAAPRLTANAATVLAALPPPNMPHDDIPLSELRAPLPASAQTLPCCPEPGVPCQPTGGTCARTFPIDTFQASLLVVGQHCNCKKSDSCWALCVWVDAEGRYASVRDPARWQKDVAGLPACHPSFDITRRAYAIGDWISPGKLAICTASGCRAERGRWINWLELGHTTGTFYDPGGSCPE